MTVTTAQQQQQRTPNPGEGVILQPEKQNKYKIQLVWRNIIFFIYLHIFMMHAWWHGLSFQIRVITYFFNTALIFLNWMGITVGAHRLWTHRSYKAKLPLRIFLCMCNCLAFQNSIYEWSRDHRTHHKFSETDADPHNAKRGFFFAHMGWLITRKHPDVLEKGKTIDMSDLEADPVVMFQKKFFPVLTVIFAYLIPWMVPVYFWGENLYMAFTTCVAWRICFTLHATWLVNSAAHLWGDKPYDKNINPSENDFVTYLSLGEGFHNYHHTFPWDYSTSEWGERGNPGTKLIDLFARWGQAYDRKKVDQSIVDKRKAIKGDGTTRWAPDNDKEQ